MRSRWVHPLFKPSDTTSRQWAPRLGVAADACLRSAVALHDFTPITDHARFGSPAAPAKRPVQHVDRLAAFIVVAVASITVTIGAVMVKSKVIRLPSISAITIPGFGSLALGQPRDKVAFLNQLSLENRRQFASQVHYVSQLMNRSKVAEADRKQLAALIVSESLRAGYDPLFVAAVIHSESTFNKHAVSGAGALGLMQIMPDTARYLSSKSAGSGWFNVAKLKDPGFNVRMGISYLKQLQETFEGNLELALIAYNWGPGNVFDALKYGKHIPSGSSIYARRIIHNHRRWNADFTRNINQFQYMNVDMVS